MMPMINTASIPSRSDKMKLGSITLNFLCGGLTTGDVHYTELCGDIIPGLLLCWEEQSDSLCYVGCDFNETML